MTTAQLDLRRTDKLETSKLRVLLREISFPTPLLSPLYIDPLSNFASYPYIITAVDCLEHAGWQGEDTELALIQQQLDPTQQGKVSRDRLLRWLTNYYSAQHVMERVQNEKTTQAKREVAACVDPALLSRAVGDEPVRSNQLHAQDTEPEHLSRSLSFDNGGFDWNAQYYKLQSDTSTADPFARGLRVAGLTSRFRQAAERVVRSIVEELSLPDEAKSVRPQLCTDCHEFLATDRLSASVWHDDSLIIYHHDGMLIYVASVRGRGPMPDDPPSGISGAIDATQTQLEFARIWKHQIKAAQALQCAIEETQRDGQRDDGAEQARSSRAYRLCVPLQCTVDYLGCRCLVVASKAMQDESTRSSSGLNSLSGVKEAIKSDLQSAFDHLGLLSEAPISSSEQEHSESNGHFTLPIFFPSDARCSVEMDEEVPVIMLHNLASLFPPVVLDGDFTNSQTNLGRLRREFVQQHGSYIPLSSNALLSVPASLDVMGEPRSPRDVGLLQLSLQSACEHLVEVVVPSFMADFEAMPLKLVHPQELTEALHAFGVNVRFLGRCYTLATQPDTKRLIMAEMLARAAKVELNISLRAIVDDCSFGSSRMSLSSASNNADNPDLTLPQPNEIAGDRHGIVRESTTRAAIEFLNLMFGTAGHPDARAFWENRLLPRARDKFSLHGDYPSLAFESIMSGESVYFPQLFHAVQMHTNIVFCDHMEYDFRSPLPVSELDLSSSKPKSRVSANTTAECEEIVAATDEFIACDQLDTALDNAKFQLAILHAGEEGGNCQPMTLSNYLSCAAELSLRLGRPTDAREYAVLAIEVAPRNHAVAARAHTIAMKLDGLSGDVDNAERHFVEATSAAKWHLGPSSGVLTDIFMTMVDVCAATGDLERAERVLDDCAKLTRQSLGRWSLPFADVCRRQAMLMYTRWQSTSAPSPDEVATVLHDAIAIYERHLCAPTSTTDGAQIKMFAASCYYLAAEMSCGAAVLDSGATQNAFTMALKGLKLRKEALSSSHGDVVASNLQLGMLAGRIGEPFRAMEYYRNALAILKQGTAEGTSSELPSNDESTHSVDRIRDVSRAMLQLFLGALSSEQQDVRVEIIVHSC